MSTKTQKTKLKYDDESRAKRSRDTAAYLAERVDLKGKRVLEVGPQMGDFARVLAEDYGCEVVGIDVMRHPTWEALQAELPQIKLYQGDVARPPAELAENSFDLVCSFVVWEHIRHPFSALKACQRLLKPDGKKFCRANLYRSSIASHLYRRLDEPWPHLMNSPEELKVKLRAKELGWAFWVNKLTYQQYLYYFRQLGFYVTYENFMQSHFDRAYYDANEQRLGLYPEWDLQTDFFEVVLEFDPKAPKQPVADPVYAMMLRV